MVKLKQLEQETRVLSENEETLIIILTQAQIHYSYIILTEDSQSNELNSSI
jgi:hypothetical protein